MVHEEDCYCVVCAEWGGRMPLECSDIPDEDYPDPFDEVPGG